MVLTWRSLHGAKVHIVARGNFSLGAGGLVSLLLALGTVTLCLAGLLAWKGYWPILVIALVQITLVSWILVRTWQSTWVMEIIDIDAGRIKVTHRRYRQERHYELDPAWAWIQWKQPAVRWYSPELMLKSRHQELELGAYLTAGEKRQLARLLQNAIENYSAMRAH